MSLCILHYMSGQTPHGVPEWTQGDRLGKSLDYAGISIAEMADFLGISRNTVGNYIAGRTHIPNPTLILWAWRTGVPREWLISGVVRAMSA
jgi:plasmid maintenance system antidote protein VapI